MPSHAHMCLQAPSHAHMCLQTPSHAHVCLQAPRLPWQHSTKGSCTGTSWQGPADRTLPEPVCKVWQQERLQTRKSTAWHSSRENVVLGWSQTCNTCEHVDSRVRSHRLAPLRPGSAAPFKCHPFIFHLPLGKARRPLTLSQRHDVTDLAPTRIGYPDTMTKTPRTYHNTTTRWLSFKNEKSIW